MSSDANGTEDQMFRRKSAYPYGKGQATESFYVWLKLGREDDFSTLNQSNLDIEEIIEDISSFS